MPGCRLRGSDAIGDQFVVREGVVGDQLGTSGAERPSTISKQCGTRT